MFLLIGIFISMNLIFILPRLMPSNPVDIMLAKIIMGGTSPLGGDSPDITPGRETAIEALRMDLDDYVLKPAKAEELFQKIEACLKKKNSSQPLNPKPTFAQNLSLEEAGLTRREKEVVQLAARGYNDTEIAKQLSISVFTVKFHLKRIFKKLGIHKRVELIVSLGK